MSVLYEIAVSALSLVSAWPHCPSMPQATRVRPCTMLPLTVSTFRLCTHPCDSVTPVTLNTKISDLPCPSSSDCDPVLPETVPDPLLYVARVCGYSSMNIRSERSVVQFPHLQNRKPKKADARMGPVGESEQECPWATCQPKLKRTPEGQTISDFPGLQFLLRFL